VERTFRGVLLDVIYSSRTSSILSRLSKVAFAAQD
jgi:hypothetical protein